jgi:predicted phage-related endonuclease
VSLTPEQIELRRKGVFASDMPKIARLLPPTWERVSWASLWEEKMGLYTWAGNATTEWGDRVAPVIANAWAELEKRPVTRHEVSQLHPEIPIIGATADYLTEDGEPVECKNVGRFMAKKWNGTPPDYVVVQVLTQCAVLGKKRGHVAARIEGSDNLVDRYVVEFNASAWDVLVKLSQEFWGYVERKERPNG